MSKRPTEHSLQTRIVHTGRPAPGDDGVPVNTPLIRASTVLFESVGQQRALNSKRPLERVFTYGVRGTPTHYALEDWVCEMEGAHRCSLVPTGLSAITVMLMAYLRPGDHLLVSDSVYEPSRRFVTQFLSQFGVQATFFQPDGSDVEARLQRNTRMVLAECPGSLIYELCDLPRLADITHRHGAWLAVDNTWGSAYQYRPLTLGADISVMAATKYLSGHSDVMMGTIATREAAWGPLSAAMGALGLTVSPDDVYLVLRGTRSLAARLAMHEAHALRVLDWLGQRPEIARCYCPALPSHPGHALWRRDFTGTNGLLSFELQPHYRAEDAERLVDALSLFGIGISWGGYESLASIANMHTARSLSHWSGRGPVIRLHIGLENPDDLIRDLAQAFQALATPSTAA